MNIAFRHSVHKLISLPISKTFKRVKFKTLNLTCFFGETEWRKSKIDMPGYYNFILHLQQKRIQIRSPSQFSIATTKRSELRHLFTSWLSKNIATHGTLFTKILIHEIGDRSTEKKPTSEHKEKKDFRKVYLRTSTGVRIILARSTATLPTPTTAPGSVSRFMSKSETKGQQ